MGSSGNKGRAVSALPLPCAEWGCAFTKWDKGETLVPEDHPKGDCLEACLDGAEIVYVACEPHDSAEA